jgi:hypothetical protein
MHVSSNGSWRRSKRWRENHVPEAVANCEVRAISGGFGSASIGWSMRSMMNGDLSTSLRFATGAKPMNEPGTDVEGDKAEGGLSSQCNGRPMALLNSRTRTGTGARSCNSPISYRIHMRQLDQKQIDSPSARDACLTSSLPSSLTRQQATAQGSGACGRLMLV